MKKNIIITFDIYQDKLDNQKPNFTVYSALIPDKEDVMTIDEIQKSGLKKMVKFNPEVKEMTENLGRNYTVRIPEKTIKELLEIN